MFDECVYLESAAVGPSERSRAVLVSDSGPRGVLNDFGAGGETTSEATIGDTKKCQNQEPPPPPSERWGLDPLFWCHVKLAVAEVVGDNPALVPAEGTNGAVHFYRNRPTRKCEMMGHVVTLNVRDNKTFFTLDDGTGCIECVVWMNSAGDDGGDVAADDFQKRDARRDGRFERHRRRRRGDRVRRVSVADAGTVRSQSRLRVRRRRGRRVVLLVSTEPIVYRLMLRRFLRILHLDVWFRRSFFRTQATLNPCHRRVRRRPMV